MTEEKERLVGLKIISWYFRIVSALLFLFGLLCFVFKDALNSAFLDALPLLISFGNSLVLAIGLFSILLGIFYFLIGRGLDKLKKWARTSTIILQIGQIGLSVILSFSGDILGNLSSLIIPVLILYYLFKKEVKESFGD